MVCALQINLGETIKMLLIRLFIDIGINDLVVALFSV